MAKRPQRKPRKKAGNAGPILPPGTRLVDNPDWDPDAPNLDLDASPKKGGARGKKKRAGKAPPKPASPPVDQKTGITVMALLAAAIVAGGAFGIWYLLDSREQERQAVADAKAAADAEAAAEAAANAPPPLPTPEEREAAYLRHITETSVEFDVPAPSVATLLQPNTFTNPATHGDPVIVAPGQAKTLGPLRFKVNVDTLNLERRGIRSKGQHTMLVLTNTTEQPVAYRLDVRKATVGDCQSPVVFNYDAMVIDAGATYEVSVCTGRQSAEILDLRTLTLTEVGAAWIRQIPPLVVGNTLMAGRAHKLANPVTECNADATEISRALEENLVKWEDVIDFYSRHDCQHYAWVSEHRLASSPLASLPVFAPERPPL